MSRAILSAPDLTAAPFPPMAQATLVAPIQPTWRTEAKRLVAMLLQTGSEVKRGIQSSKHEMMKQILMMAGAMRTQKPTAEGLLTKTYKDLSQVGKDKIAALIGGKTKGNAP